MRELYMVDLDGVMNSMNLRNHLIPATEMAKCTAMGWAEWHAHHHLEAFNDEMIDLLNAAHARGVAVVFSSMRLDTNTIATRTALIEAGLDFVPVLWLRSEDDDTQPPAAKAKDVLRAAGMFVALGERAQITMIEDSLDNVKAIHACPRIAEMTAAHGITVLTMLMPQFKAVA